MTWITIALIASFLYGTTNFIDRFLVEKRMQDPFFVSIIGGIVAPIMGLIIFVMRGSPIFSWQDMAVLALGGICSEVALVPWYKAIKMDDTSRVVPYFQFIPVVVLVMAYVLLGERLTTNQLIGFVLIIGGGLSLAVERSARELFRVRRSFWYIMGAVILFAPIGVLFKVVAVDRNFWDSLAYELMGVGLGAIVLQMYAKRDVWRGMRAMSTSTWGIVGMNEGLYLCARVLQFYAVLIGPTALVSVVGGIQPLFALIIGLAMSTWFPNVIKEDIKVRVVLYKLAAILVMFVGVIFINK